MHSLSQRFPARLLGILNHQTFPFPVLLLSLPTLRMIHTSMSWSPPKVCAKQKYDLYGTCHVAGGRSSGPALLHWSISS